ncbi:Uncharacterised protein [Mycobacteroides abscessus subsp. abscessus]|nr:Uncharacterised protein [Mycobacteroides abscessus subsp. abscessus]
MAHAATAFTKTTVATVVISAGTLESPRITAPPISHTSLRKAMPVSVTTHTPAVMATSQYAMYAIDSA